MIRKSLLSLRKNMSTSSVEHHEIVIVGGGISGLFAAKKLIEGGAKDIVILEGRFQVGGRVVTKKDDDGNPVFNDFAWRVGEENTMMIELAKELGLTLQLQTTPKPDPKLKNHSLEPREILKNRAPLSHFAQASLQAASHADLQDRESGYAGRTAQITWPDDKHGANNYMVKEGMNAYAISLEKLLPEGVMRKMQRVADVSKIEEGKYKLDIIKRAGGNLEPYSMTCNKVILAAPPYVLRGFSVAKDMQPALFAVHERRLGHCFAKVRDGTENVPDKSDGEDRIYRMLPESILQQIISGDYGDSGGKGYFQAAYACDRFERVWRELQFQGPDILRDTVQEQLQRIEDINPELYKSIEEVFLRISYVHRWQIESHVMGKTKEELSLQAITPNPANLPNLFLVGEAFSPFQGWTEGALWTADKAANIILTGKGFSKYSLPIEIEKNNEGKIVSASTTNKPLVYKNHVIDGSEWSERHPGGPGAITNFVGKDITEMFNSFHIGNPSPLATLFGLQNGTTK